MFATIVGVLSVIACMSYEYAIVNPKSDKDAASLLVISLNICALFAFCIIAPMMFLIGEELLDVLQMTELKSVLWLIPIAVWLAAAYIALNYWNTRTKNFTRLSIARVVGAASGTSGSLGFGFTGFTTGSYMIAAQTGGQAISTAVLGTKIARDNGQFIIKSLSWRRISVLLVKYKKFPIYYTISNLINTFSSQLPVFMFGIFFSPAVVGFYALSLRLLQAPMGLLGGAISQVFHEKAATAKIDGTLPKLVANTFDNLVQVGVFPILLTGIFAVELFGLLFGSEWAEAGLYTAILSPWISFFFISSPISILTAVLDLQRVSLFFSIISFFMRFVSILIGAYYQSVIIALLLFSASGVLIYLTKCFVLNRYAKVPHAVTFKIILNRLWIVILPVLYVIFLNYLQLESSAAYHIFGYFAFVTLWIVTIMKTLKHK